MAKCDLGYLCEVCGGDVEDITNSDLYLRFILGEVEARFLMTAPERHLRCNPVAAQFIVDPGFEPIVVEGVFDKRKLDPSEVARGLFPPRGADASLSRSLARRWRPDTARRHRRVCHEGQGHGPGGQAASGHHRQ